MQRDSQDPATLETTGLVVPDTTALKALVHPQRLRMLGLLRADGPATATLLAKRLSLNSGATSYHLRQLAKYGFVDPADDLGDRRDRWWRARHQATIFDPSDKTGDALDTGLAMTQAVISLHTDLLQRALGEYPTLPVAWRRASSANDIIVRLTAEEARALTDRLMDTLREAQTANAASGRPNVPGERNFMVVLHTFPLPDLGQAAVTTERA